MALWLVMMMVKLFLFQEKPSVEEARSNKVNTGIYIFEPEVLDLIPSGEQYDIGGDLFPQIVKKGLSFHSIDLPV